MRLSRVVMLFSACLASLPLLAAGAFAGSVEVEGKLLNAPIPQSYNLTGADLYFNQGKPYVEVRGEGDCHTEWHQECHMQGNPPQYVCHNVPQWTCVQDRVQFAMPTSVTLRNKDVFFAGPAGELKIGQVKSFLFWTWIKLGGNAKLVVAHNRATLRIDTGAGAPVADRQETFAKLYPEPVGDLMVKFRNVNNAGAVKALRELGYEGEVAHTNDWSARDVTSDEIGVRLPVKQAAKLIATLKTSPQVVGVRPAGTAAGE